MSQDYKNYIIAGLGVLALLLFIIIGGGFRFNFSGDWQKYVPKWKDLATSPAVRDLAKNEASKDVAMPPVSEESIAAEINDEEVESALSEESVVRETIAVAPAHPSTAPRAGQTDIIMIPEINITTPLVTPLPGTDAIKLKQMLDDGAVIYPDSSPFGAAGQTIVLGHSAPPGWPEIKHDTIFSRIAELSFGSKIIAVHNDKTYTYSAVENRIIEKGGDIPKLARTENVLVLVTCWPPGRDLKRMVVQADLISID